MTTLTTLESEGRTPRRGGRHDGSADDTACAKVNLYEVIAEKIVCLIDGGTFRPGDKVPSIRQLHQQYRVSLSTAMEAYRVLEDRGVIEARPQSGYYVRANTSTAPELTRAGVDLGNGGPADCCLPSTISIPEVHIQVLNDTLNPGLVQLGATTPDPELAPIEKLSRIQMALFHRHGPAPFVRYDLPPGLETLRTQIARRMLRAGCSLGPDKFVTTLGAQEAMYLALRATCQPGDTVAIESPVFYGILQAIQSLGLKALEMPTCWRDGISVDALEYALDQTRISAVLVVSNFSNPLGSVMPTASKKELVRLLAEHDVPLIEDDIYGELHHGLERPDVLKAYDRTGNVLLCSSFSKTISPGYRVGWIAPGKYQKQVEHLKLVSNLASPAPTQLSIAEFLTTGGYERHLRMLRRIYARQTSQVADAVRTYFPEGTKTTRPHGGFILWVECPQSVDSVRLYCEAVERGITFAPGPIFSATGRYSNCLRLNTAYWTPAVEQAVETLGKLAKRMC